jgi:hypothetical protein
VTDLPELTVTEADREVMAERAIQQAIDTAQFYLRRRDWGMASNALVAARTLLDRLVLSEEAA